MSAKRRAGNAASPELATPITKRRRTTDTGVHETAESTTEIGLRLLQLLKKCKDSRGRDVATEFLTLPDRKLFPEYYEEIKLPLALDTIEEKLHGHKYSTLEQLEGDVKRLIQNARDFNERGSLIAEDAERLRKAMANFMPKYNPKYADENYKAVPTPIPAHLLTDSPEPEEETPDTGKRQSLKIKLTNKRGSDSPAVSTPITRTSSRPTRRSTISSFEGKTFQRAQEMIIEELIDLKDEDGNEVAPNFLERPDKKRYADYYRKISKPVALLILQKRVKGFLHNRMTGTSLYHSWDEFASDVRLLWNNARIYNEEGSEIYELAGKLEDYFEPRLAEARSKVKDPPTQNGDGGVRLKLTMNSSSETPEPAQKKLILTHNAQTQSTVTVDSESLKRQQELVRAGSSGDVKSEAGEGQKPTANGTPTPATTNGMDTKTNGVAENTVQVGGPTSSQTPVKTGSATPNPQAAAAAPPAPPPPPPKPVQYVPTSILDTRLRGPGKDINSALIETVNISTHPGIKIGRHFQFDIPASPSLTQQSYTLNLAPSHYYLRVTVKLSPNAKDRVAKKVVLIQNGVMRSTANNDADSPMYDFRLNPGVNVIWVDLIAGPSRSSAKTNSMGEAVDFERVTIYANLLRP